MRQEAFMVLCQHHLGGPAQRRAGRGILPGCRLGAGERSCAMLLGALRPAAAKDEEDVMGKAMGKSVAAGACALFMTATVLTGCAANDSDRQILEKLDAMEAELDALKEDRSQSDAAGNEARSEDARDSASGEGGAAGGSATRAGEGLAQELTAAYPELADFEQRTIEVEAACDLAEPADTRDENYRIFLDMKYEIDLLDHDMDAYDDEQEYAARSGELSYEEYMRIERAIDYLDDRLEHAEDGMELRLGIDD